MSITSPDDPRKLLLRRAECAEEIARIDRALAECMVHASTALPIVYSQLDGQRPAGVGRVRYLRAWRRGRDAGDLECTADGRARLMAAAAWQRHGASTPTRRTPLRLVVDNDSSVLTELGLGASK